MKHIIPFIFLLVMVTGSVTGQVSGESGKKFLIHGLVVDAESRSPLPGTRVTINREFLSNSDREGRFAFYVSGLDTVVFSRVGYKSERLIVSDTLVAPELIAGVYMQADTVLIGEVIIIPRLYSLRSDMLSPVTNVSPEIEYARHNLAVSSYQGRVSQGNIGDPAANYEILRQKQRADAYSKGQIPSDRILGLSPFMLIPLAHLLMNGLPEKPPPLQPRLSGQEVNQLHRKYIESKRQEAEVKEKQ